MHTLIVVVFHNDINQVLNVQMLLANEWCGRTVKLPPLHFSKGNSYKYDTYDHSCN